MILNIVTFIFIVFLVAIVLNSSSSTSKQSLLDDNYSDVDRENYNDIKRGCVDCGQRAYNAESRSTNALSNSKPKYIFLKTTVKGGLHNQLMALIGYGDIAAQLGRILIVPEFSAQFPGKKEKAVKFSDIFESYKNQLSLMELPNTSFPSLLYGGDKSELHFTKKIKSIEISSKSSVNAFLKKASSYKDEKVLIIKPRFDYQPFNQELLVSYYKSFQPNEKLKKVLVKTMNKYVNSNQMEEDKKWDSVIVIHLRIEEDWKYYAKLKKFEGSNVFIDFPIIQQRVNHFLQKTNSDTLCRTIILCYASSAQKDFDVNYLKQGWLPGYKIVTNQEIDEEMKKHYCGKTLSYLEKSLLLAQISYKSFTFIGNYYSSFSSVILSARDKNSYIYNNENVESYKVGFLDIK